MTRLQEAIGLGLILGAIHGFVQPAFSVPVSYTQADAIPTSAPTVGTVGNLTGQTSYASGTAGDLAGTVTSANVLTVTAGGAGSTAIGQFVSEITVID